MAETLAIGTDTSEFQGSYYTDAYGHRIASFRCMDGTSYTDKKFVGNLAWCEKAYKANQIDFFIIYFVYRVGAAGDFAAWRAKIGMLPAGAVLMIDVESWSGAISGNRSSDLNSLYGSMAGFAGSYNRVIGYGNKGDLAGLWPQRDSRCRVIVASYGTSWTFRSVAGAIGQQYSDGESKYGSPSGYPISSSPFGNCDHNGFPDYTPKALAALLGVTKTATAEENEMIMIEDQPTSAGGTGGIALIGGLIPYHIGSMTTVNALVAIGIPLSPPWATADYAAAVLADRSDGPAIEAQLAQILAQLQKNATTPAQIAINQTIPASLTIGSPA